MRSLVHKVNMESEAVAGGTGAGRSVRLERRLGKLDVTLVGVGASIGAGIFVISGVAARLAGPSVILSFFSASIVCMLNALCYAGNGQQLPGQRIGLCLRLGRVR